MYLIIIYQIICLHFLALDTLLSSFSFYEILHFALNQLPVLITLQFINDSPKKRNLCAVILQSFFFTPFMVIELSALKNRPRNRLFPERGC